MIYKVIIWLITLISLEVYPNYKNLQINVKITFTPLTFNIAYILPLQLKN